MQFSIVQYSCNTVLVKYSEFTYKNRVSEEFESLRPLQIKFTPYIKFELIDPINL